MPDWTDTLRARRAARSAAEPAPPAAADAPTAEETTAQENWVAATKAADDAKAAATKTK
jgi:hypothetical protein